MNAPTSLPVVIDPCWNRIGVKGDQSCPKLQAFVHCHNCPVFAAAAQQFLDRPLPEAQEEQASTRLAQTASLENPRNSLSVVVCEVEQQLLALETKAVALVTEVRSVHKIGNRTGRVFLGIVNIHGQLELCASLKGLLQIAAATPATPGGAVSRKRMVLLEQSGQRWVFPVDAVHGVQRFDPAQMCDVPATAQHDASALVSKVLKWNERRVGFLDLEKAVSSLNKSLQ